MKIFISWSGEHAKQVALVFREWLKDVFDSAEPWVSDVDIAGGTYSLPSIAEALAGAKFGIVVTTQANQATPWINFEAGALSKVIDSAEVRVMPMLVDLRVSGLTSPLKQFQAAPIDAEGVGKLIRSVGEVLGLEQPQIERKAKIFWPQLEEALAALPAIADDVLAHDEDEADKGRPESDVLDEILTVVRELRRDRPPRLPTLDEAFMSNPTVSNLARSPVPGRAPADPRHAALIDFARSYGVDLRSIRWRGPKGTIIEVTDGTPLSQVHEMSAALAQVMPDATVIFEGQEGDGNE